MFRQFKKALTGAVAAMIVGGGALTSATAGTISLAGPDFVRAPIFSNVTTFSFLINLGQYIGPGNTYTNPAIHSVDYTVQGNLAPGTPSGFAAFLLNRPEHPPAGLTFPGFEFYAQGSSLQFAVLPGADLTDGLQADELGDLGGGLIFELNAREVGTGRYHPPLLQLYNDGTGLLQNSNNMGGINPATNLTVNVNFGDEYITELTFNPADLTIATGVSVPAVLALAAPFAIGLACAHRRGRLARTRKQI